jgi:hypothetical protein
MIATLVVPFFRLSIDFVAGVACRLRSSSGLALSRGGGL